jgi:hypothetical protein
VHGPAVVGEHDAAQLEQRHKLPQRGFPGQVENAPSSRHFARSVARSPNASQRNYRLRENPRHATQVAGQRLAGPPAPGFSPSRSRAGWREAGGLRVRTMPPPAAFLRR